MCRRSGWSACRWRLLFRLVRCALDFPGVDAIRQHTFDDVERVGFLVRQRKSIDDTAEIDLVGIVVEAQWARWAECVLVAIFVLECDTDL